MVVATWELPDRAADQDAWELEVLDRYDELARHWLDELEVTLLCMYRTHDELVVERAADPQLGRQVPELV
jgi:hypothetical protein